MIEIINRKFGLGLVVIGVISFALISTATVGFGQPGFSVDNLSGTVIFVPDKLEPGVDFTMTITISNAENASPITVTIGLYEDNTLRLDNKTIPLGDNESKVVILSGRAGKKDIQVKIQDNFIVATKPIELPAGYSLMLLLAVGTILLLLGIAVGWKLFRGRGEGIVERVGPKPRVGDNQARDAMDKADDEARRAGDALKEASRQDVDVSAEQEMLKKAQEFDGMARKEYRDERYDSAFAYAGATSALGSGVTSALEARMKEARGAAEAKRKAEADIRAAEGAIREVKSKIGEAESTGIDAKPATSLTDLASEIMKAAGAAKDPETYRFQSTTAKRIAEHAAASLKGSIEGQKDQVKRTADALAGAKGALGKAEATIEKQRKEFDTLVPEYWLGVANEVYSIAEDKKLNTEVREAMADTSTKICEWIDDMFERRDIRARMKKGKGITLR